jgi:hypothetical protein
MARRDFNKIFYEAIVEVMTERLGSQAFQVGSLID